MRAWIAAQLADPSNILHGVGIGILVGEVVQHWFTHRPVDQGTIEAGFGCIIGGVASDRLGTKA